MNDKIDTKKVEEIAEQTATEVYNNLGTRFGVARVPIHIHNGVDTLRVSFQDLIQRTLVIHWTVPGAQSATATNFGTFWTAPFACTVTAFSEVHETAGTDAGAVTLQLERLQGTEAPGAGDELLSTALSLKTTANTVQYGTMLPLVQTRNLNKGDRLCLKDAGVLTALSNVSTMTTILY